MKRYRLGSIITAASTPEQIALTVQWLDSASSVYIITKQPHSSAFGWNGVKSKKDIPSLKEAILGHLGRIRGRETIGICLPNIILPQDFSPLDKSLASNRMEMNWAFKYRINKSSPAPDFFVITTSLLPHISNALKDDVPFTGTAWAIWLDNWCKKGMLPHKYIDISDSIKVTYVNPGPSLGQLTDSHFTDFHLNDIPPSPPHAPIGGQPITIKKQFVDLLISVKNKIFTSADDGTI